MKTLLYRLNINTINTNIAFDIRNIIKEGIIKSNNQKFKAKTSCLVINIINTSLYRNSAFRFCQINNDKDNNKDPKRNGINDLNDKIEIEEKVNTTNYEINQETKFENKQNNKENFNSQEDSKEYNKEYEIYFNMKKKNIDNMENDSIKNNNHKFESESSNKENNIKSNLNKNSSLVFQLEKLFEKDFKVLGVDKDTDASKIKTKYLMLAKLYHPDLTKNDDFSTQMFKDITFSYERIKLLNQLKKGKLLKDFDMKDLKEIHEIIGKETNEANEENIKATKKKKNKKSMTKEEVIEEIIAKNLAGEVGLPNNLLVWLIIYISFISCVVFSIDYYNYKNDVLINRMKRNVNFRILDETQ